MNESDGAVLIRDHVQHTRRQPPDPANAPQLPLNRAPGRLEFSRTDLVFRFQATEIEIALRVCNAGRARSKREVGRIEAAPFGAFLPWTPLTTFEVPPLDPGAATIVRMRVPRPELGDLPDGEDATRARTRALRQVARMLMRFGMASPWSANPKASHFAGNLDVHVKGISVERHCGSLRVRRGARNVAMFRVGDGTDAYRFAVGGTSTGWDVELLGSEDIEPGRWYRGECVRCVRMEATDASESAPDGRLEVHVEQRSTGRTAIVEFELAGR